MPQCKFTDSGLLIWSELPEILIVGGVSLLRFDSADNHIGTEKKKLYGRCR